MIKIKNKPRGLQRAILHERRPVPPIEAITVMIADRNSACAQEIRLVPVSLPRVRILEKEFAL